MARRPVKQSTLRGDAAQMFKEEFLRRTMLRTLEYYKRAFFADSDQNSAMIKLLRAWLMPSQGMSFAEHDRFEHDLYDPTPENSFERAVSGMISLHWSPFGKYFKLSERKRVLDMQGELETNIELATSRRTQAIHDIVQESPNFQCMAVNARDKMGLGMAGREIDEDSELLARFTPIPPEDLALASSNGRVLDIYGKREKLTLFQMRQRFPEPLIPDYWSEKYFTNPFNGQTKMIYRFNFPHSVFRDLMIYSNEAEEDSTYARNIRKVLSELIGNPSEKKAKGMWVDIWWCEDGVLSIGTTPFRRIIASMMSPPYSVMNFARGQGEKAIPLMLQISDLTVASHSGFEKTFSPAWSVENEVSKLGLDLGRDGVTFIDRGSEHPKPLTLGANIGDAVTFTQYKQALFDRMMYLDVFELLNKSRMTKAEVNIRDVDDLKKMGLYLVQDQHDDLNPTTLAVNYMIHQQLGKEDELSQRVLSARYTSALAFAINSNVFMKMDKVFTIAQKGMALSDPAMPINDNLDIAGYLEKQMVKVGEEEILRNEEDKNERQQERARQQQTEQRAKNAQALGAVGTTLGQLQQTQQGGQGQQGTQEQQR